LFVNPTTPRTPDEAYESILRMLFNAIAQAEPGCRMGDPLAVLWCLLLRTLIRLVAGFGRVSAASPRKAVAPGALPKDRTSPDRPMPKASMHGGMLGRLLPQPEIPAPVASAHHAGRTRRPQTPQSEPTVGVEPTVAAEPAVAAEPSLVPSGTWPGPDHAKPLAATHVDIPSPVPKTRFGRAGCSRVQFVTVS
jgi:hypothetical protein